MKVMLNTKNLEFEKIKQKMEVVKIESKLNLNEKEESEQNDKEKILRDQQILF